MPDLMVSDMAKAKRTGKVFVDWSQNDRHKTTVNVYSLRAMERPTVSTPLTWDEVADMADGAPLAFTSAEVLERVAAAGGSVRAGADAGAGAARASYAGTRAPGPAWARTSLAPSLAPQVVHVRWASSVPPQSRWVSTTGGPSGA